MLTQPEAVPVTRQARPHGVYCVQRVKGLAHIGGSLCEEQPQVPLIPERSCSCCLHTLVCAYKHLYLHTLLSIRTQTRGRFCHPPDPHPCGGSVAISVGSHYSHDHITNIHSGLHLLLSIYPVLPQLCLNDVLQSMWRRLKSLASNPSFI